MENTDSFLVEVEVNEICKKEQRKFTARGRFSFDFGPIAFDAFVCDWLLFRSLFLLLLYLFAACFRLIFSLYIKMSSTFNTHFYLFVDNVITL